MSVAALTENDLHTDSSRIPIVDLEVEPPHPRTPAIVHVPLAMAIMALGVWLPLRARIAQHARR